MVSAVEYYNFLKILYYLINIYALILVCDKKTQFKVLKFEL